MAEEARAAHRELGQEHARRGEGAGSIQSRAREHRGGTLSDEAAEMDARELARGVSAYWEEKLGERLLGFYFMGSLAHGGFSARYSDIDVGLISTDGLVPAEIEAMRDYARARAPALAHKLSLFWADRGFTIGRFPPLDRLDYLDHARPLIERERALPPRPARDEVRAYLRGQPLNAWREQIGRITALNSLDDATR